MTASKVVECCRRKMVFSKRDSSGADDWQNSGCSKLHTSTIGYRMGMFEFEAKDRGEFFIGR